MSSLLVECLKFHLFQQLVICETQLKSIFLPLSTFLPIKFVNDGAIIKLTTTTGILKMEFGMFKKLNLLKERKLIDRH